MQVNEILLTKDQKDRSLSSAEKKELGLLKKKIGQYIDALAKPGTSDAQSKSLRKKLSSTVDKIEKLSESLNGTLNFDIEENTDGSLVASFWVGEVPYLYRALLNVKTGLWLIEFIDNSRGDEEMYSLTGTGNASEVMGTVLNITRYLLGMHPEAKGVYFLAKESSRKNLYTRIVKKLCPDWKIEQEGNVITATKPTQQVNELFDQYNNIDWLDTYVSAQFTVGDVTYIFDAQPLEQDDMPPNSWGIAFKKKQKRDPGVSRDVMSKDSFGITGDGNSAQVFGNVISIMKEFLKHERVGALYFSAEEPSRVKLYRALAKRFLSDWELVFDDGYEFIYKKPSAKVMEAVHKVPLVEEDFESIKDILENPIPAVMARIVLDEFIIDDELSDMLESIEEMAPNRDIRPLVVEWIKRVMPDQLWRFGIGGKTNQERTGLMSPIHGYDPHMHKGQVTQSSGNAYGRY